MSSTLKPGAPLSISDWCTCLVVKWMTRPASSGPEVAPAAVTVPAAATSARTKTMPRRVGVARLMPSPWLVRVGGSGRSDGGDSGLHRLAIADRDGRAPRDLGPLVLVAHLPARDRVGVARDRCRRRRPRRTYGSASQTSVVGWAGRRAVGF